MFFKSDVGGTFLSFFRSFVLEGFLEGFRAGGFGSRVGRVGIVSKRGDGRWRFRVRGRHGGLIGLIGNERRGEERGAG